MKARVHSAPLALASDGTVLVNLTEFDGPGDPASLLEQALRQQGRLFIGVELTAAEVADVLPEATQAHQEVTARIAGRRQRRG